MAEAKSKARKKTLNPEIYSYGGLHNPKSQNERLMASQKQRLMASQKLRKYAKISILEKDEIKKKPKSAPKG